MEMEAMEALLVVGETWVHDLYSLRSLSRTLPSSLGSMESVTFNGHVAKLLRPRMRLLVGLMGFVDKTITQTCRTLAFLMQPKRKSRATLPKIVLGKCVQLMDVITMIDHMKDMKSLLQNDFTAFKRAMANLKTVKEFRDDVEFNDQVLVAIQGFLVDQRFPKSNISHRLKAAIHAMPLDHSEVLGDVLGFVLGELENDRYLLAEEKFRLIRFLPHLLYLADAVSVSGTTNLPSVSGAAPLSMDHFKPFNAFKSKKFASAQIKALFKRYPVVPLFGDMHITMIFVLERCPNFQTLKESNSSVVYEWGGIDSKDDDPSAGASPSGSATKEESAASAKREEDKKNYELSNHWKTIRTEYDEFSCRFAATCRRVETEANNPDAQARRAADAAETMARERNNQMIEPPELRRRRLKNEAMDREAYDVALEGLKLLNKWKSMVLFQSAYKYSRGATAEQIKVLLVAASSPLIATTIPGAAFVLPDTVSEYDRVVRYNYSSTELVVLFDVVCAIKSVASLMTEHAPVMAAPIRRKIYVQLQEFSQLRVMRMLHSIHKRKKNETESLLLSLRNVCVDWLGESPLDAARDSDFKDKKPPKRLALFEKHADGITVADDDDVPATATSSTSKDGTGEDEKFLSNATRTLGPTPTQLHLLRGFIEWLRDPDKSESMLSSWNPLSNADFDRAQSEILRTVYNESFFYPYLLGLEARVAEAADMSALWMREFYLEMTKQIQFPIASSLPWITAKEIVENPSSNMIDSLLVFLDIYNDAAEFALKKLKQRFLFDEIEAEVKLVFEQVVFLMADSLYAHFKSSASHMFLEKLYRTRLQELRRGKKKSTGLLTLQSAAAQGKLKALNVKSNRYLEVEYRRYGGILSERAFHLLGRNVDLSRLIANQLNQYIAADLSIVLRRYESQGLTSAHELLNLLNVVRAVHESFATTGAFRLDDFKYALAQADDRAAVPTLNTRLINGITAELCADLLRNYCYNGVTERFIKRAYPAPLDFPRPSKPQGMSPNFLYSAAFKDAFQKVHVLEYEFFSSLHLDCLIKSCTFDVPGAQYAISVCAHFAEQVLSVMMDSLSRVTPALTKLSKQLQTQTSPPFKTGNQVAQHFVGAQAFQAFEQSIKTLLPHREDETRKELFQAFREIGNGLALLKLLHAEFDRLEAESFAQSSHVVGLDVDLGLGQDAYRPPNVLNTPLVCSVSEQATHEEFEFAKSEAEVRLNDARPNALFKTSCTQFSDFIKSSPLATIDFAKLWCVLEFSFASTAFGSPTAIPARDGDDAECGDGFLWAGLFVIHALGQRARFELMDLCAHVARADILERCSKSDRSSIKLDVKLTAFLICVRECIEPTKAMVFSTLGNVFSEHDSSAITEEVLFHPPGWGGTNLGMALETKSTIAVRRRRASLEATPDTCDGGPISSAPTSAAVPPPAPPFRSTASREVLFFEVPPAVAPFFPEPPMAPPAPVRAPRRPSSMVVQPLVQEQSSGVVAPPPPIPPRNSDPAAVTGEPPKRPPRAPSVRIGGAPPPPPRESDYNPF